MYQTPCMEAAISCTILGDQGQRIYSIVGPAVIKIILIDCQYFLSPN